MQLKSSIVGLSGVLVAMNGVLAAPQAPSSGSIYACDTWNFAGTCENIGFNNGECVNFPPELQDDISSIGPDGGWTCQLYVDWFCNDDQGHITVAYPGISEMTFDNDALSSFVCTWSG